MVSVSIVIAANYRAQSADVMAELEQTGFQVESVLPNIGIVTGTVPEGKLEAIRKIPAVESVEEQRSIELPPPDSPIQ